MEENQFAILASHFDDGRVGNVGVEVRYGSGLRGDFVYEGNTEYFSGQACGGAG